MAGKKYALIDADCIAHAVSWNFQRAEDLDAGWPTFRRNLRDLVEKCWCDDAMVAVKGRDNYRDRLYPEYKATRKSNPDTAPMVKHLRQRAIDEGLAIEAYGREADDMLNIWSVECTDAGDEFVICTIDKDLDTIPGPHYNIKHGKFYEVSREQATRFYWQQVLSGDPTDNIPGLPGIGPKKAAAMLEDCEDDEDYHERVRLAYKSKYQKDWRDMLLSNGKMIHIQRRLDDYFTFEG